jgi:hypothetical protein
MRPALALVAGVATAAFGALILGEYQLTGFTGLIAGSLFGLAIAEVVLTVGGAHLAGTERVAMIVIAVATVAAVAWAGWISTGHLWRTVPKGLWTGAVVGAVLGPWWLRSGVSRARSASQS